MHEVVKSMISGETPPGIAKIWRDSLEKENADYEKVRKFQFILTSKGRQ